MRITLTIVEPDSPGGSAVEVDATAATSVGALGGALAEALATGTAGVPTEVYLGGQLLPAAATLAEAGVRDGAVLGLGGPGAQQDDPPGLLELRFVGGAGSGTVYRLPAGDYEVGPGATIDVPAGEQARPQVWARLTVQASGAAGLVAETEGLRLTDRDLVPGERTAWAPGSQLVAAAALLELAPVVRRTGTLRPTEDGLRLEFNRPPRFVPPVPQTRFRLPGKPPKAPRGGLPILPVVLIPLVGSIVTVLITGNWRLIFIGLLSPLGALFTRTSSRRRAMADFKAQLTDHVETDARIRADIEAALVTEQYALRLAHPDPATLLGVATEPGDRLWERRRGDSDYLRLRVGTGPVRSSIEVNDPEQDEHRRTTSPTLQEVPAAVDLTAGVVGVAGPAAVARWLVAEAAVLHSPTDLRIVVLAGTDGEATWQWCRWLPHCAVEGDTAWALIGTTTESIARRVAEIVALISERAGRKESGGSADADVLVVLDGARRLRSLPGVIGILRDGPAVGVHLLCIDNEERRLPEECRTVLRYGPTEVILAGPGGAELRLRADEPEPSWYEAIARGMAGITAAGDAEASALPNAARLVDLLGLADASAQTARTGSPNGSSPLSEAVRAGWALGGRSTQALLGVGLDGDFRIDISRDGPHALIAGTTGSGKSELLQTLVAALAAANRPDEMTFVLIDYKGGSAFAECAELPHTVGMVTDLDTHLVERALVSLGAELRRRERQLADVGAKDIVDYTDRRARNASLPPLPRLVLIVDEFASMIRELPDFVTGLVNLAQRGRSLGIHLVLATQRPSGAVTADIRANTNLRIALRTTDPAESRDIIDAPDAAELSPRTPGRAYARLSHSALLPFQSGRVGGRRRSAEPAEGTAIGPSVTAVSWADLGSPIAPADRRRPDSDGGEPTAGGEAVTDMADLARAMRQAAADIPPVPPPWLPPLPTLLELPEPTPHEPGPDGRLGPVTWGRIDLPDQQVQVPLELDLDTAGHIHILGASRSGRSQALRTVAAALASTHPVSDCHLYGIDCGNGALLALTALPHCAAVVDHRGQERLNRVLTRLAEEVARRQNLLGSRGVADLAELRGQLPAADRPPHLVVLVDRFEVFERDFAQYDNGSYLDRMLALLRDGAALGVHLVISGDRVLGSSRYAGTTEDKIVLRLNDPGDWTLVGVRTKDVPESLPAGRGLRPRDVSEVQIAVLPTAGEGTDTSGSAQALALERLGHVLAERAESVDAARRPTPIRPLPERLEYADAVAAAPVRTSPMWALVGVGGNELAALGPDLYDSPTFLIGGPPRSGRSTALLTMARSLLEGGTGLIVIAPRRSPLRDLAGHAGVTAVLTDPDGASGPFREALQAVPEKSGAIVVDDAELMLTSDLSADLAALARGAGGEGWAVVAGGNADALSSGLGGWAAVARRNRYGLLLSPQNLSDGEVVGTRINRGLLGTSPVAGRGHLHLGDGNLVAVQIPDTHSEEEF